MSTPSKRGPAPCKGASLPSDSADVEPIAPVGRFSGGVEPTEEPPHE